jgi:uncharacterized protein YbaR (Trm112 family)
MGLDPLLVEILVCPEDKQPLWYLEDEDSLLNLRLRRRYPVRDGIPVLLVEEAEPIEGEELARLEQKVAREGVLTGGGGAPPPAGAGPEAGPPGTGGS